MQLPSTITQLSAYNTEKETETTWSKINHGLTTLQTSTTTPQSADLVYTHLSPLLHTSLLSERSILSGTALTLLNVLLDVKNSAHFEFLSTLFKLVNRNSKLIFKRTEPVLCSLVAKLPLDVKLITFLKMQFKSQNKMVRFVVVKSCKIKYFGSECGFDSKINKEISNTVNSSLKDELQKIIDSAKVDQTLEVRTLAKENIKEKEFYSPLKKIVKTEQKGFFVKTEMPPKISKGL